MHVLILAAGRGKRMGKYTEEKQKAMLPLNIVNERGVTEQVPMLKMTLLNCVRNGLTKFTIVVGYKRNDIVNYFGSGAGLGITIDYVYQPDITGGTADAVRVAKEYITTDKFLLIYGDVVPTVQDIHSLIHSRPNESKPGIRFLGCMGTRIVDNPSRYGVVRIENNFIVDIVEKSPNPPSNSIFAGLCVLPNVIFHYILQTPKSTRGEYELTDSIKMFINDGFKLMNCPVSGVKDIGTVKDYEEVQGETNTNYPIIETECLTLGHHPYVIVGNPLEKNGKETQMQVVGHSLGRNVWCIDEKGTRFQVPSDWLLAYDCVFCHK